MSLYPYPTTPGLLQAVVLPEPRVFTLRNSKTTGKDKWLFWTPTSMNEMTNLLLFVLAICRKLL
jgi:hypothetical protein